MASAVSDFRPGCRLMGVQLIGTYLLIALLYLFVPNFAPNTNHALL